MAQKSMIGLAKIANPQSMPSNPLAARCRCRTRRNMPIIIAHIASGSDINVMD